MVLEWEVIVRGCTIGYYFGFVHGCCVCCGLIYRLCLFFSLWLSCLRFSFVAAPMQFNVGGVEVQPRFRLPIVAHPRTGRHTPCKFYKAALGQVLRYACRKPIGTVKKFRLGYTLPV